MLRALLTWMLKEGEKVIGKVDMDYAYHLRDVAPWWLVRFAFIKVVEGPRKITSPGYPLRPEIVESTYYLYKLSDDPSTYLYIGEKLWRDFVQHCRTPDAYAALKDVRTKEKSDSMQSFLFAETFKYFYLLFAPADTLDFRNVIFNTEAHPIRKFK